MISPPTQKLADSWCLTLNQPQKVLSGRNASHQLTRQNPDATKSTANTNKSTQSMTSKFRHKGMNSVQRMSCIQGRAQQHFLTTCNMACKPGDKSTKSTKSDSHKFSGADTPYAYSRTRWRLLQRILLQWPLLWTASCLSLLLNGSKPQSVSGHAMISVSLLSYQPLRAEISTHTHPYHTNLWGGGRGGGGGVEGIKNQVQNSSPCQQRRPMLFPQGLQFC